MPAKHLFVYGKVQGVFYRKSAKHIAEKLKLIGWIKNRPDGSVESIIQGEEFAILKFLEWCRMGPAGASVEKIEIKEINDFDNLKQFSIK